VEMPKLYTLAEVAQNTGLSLRALADGARAGKFAHVHQGGHRYMTIEQVHQLIQVSTVTPDPIPDDLAPLRRRLMQRSLRNQAGG